MLLPGRELDIGLPLQTVVAGPIDNLQFLDLGPSFPILLSRVLCAPVGEGRAW